MTTTEPDWPAIQRELLTNDQARDLAGGVTRHTLLAWRARNTNPFPTPVITLPGGGAKTIELWSRTQVAAWLGHRDG